jgi:hypothetical protein
MKHPGAFIRGGRMTVEDSYEKALKLAQLMKRADKHIGYLRAKEATEECEKQGEEGRPGAFIMARVLRSEVVPDDVLEKDAVDIAQLYEEIFGTTESL